MSFADGWQSVKLFDGEATDTTSAFVSFAPERKLLFIFRETASLGTVTVSVEGQQDQESTSGTWHTLGSYAMAADGEYQLNVADYGWSRFRARTASIAGGATVDCIVSWPAR